MTFQIGNNAFDLVIPSLSAAQQTAASSYTDFFTIYGFLLQQLWPLWLAIGLVLGYVVYLMVKRNQFDESVEYVLFAVTVPPENEKTPKAMEQVMTAIYATDSPPNFYEEWILGERQLEFSFEIVGINGHVRFLFRVPTKLRPIFVAHVFAHYPDAEIQEVEDYVNFAPNHYPNEAYNVYGGDLALTKEDAYPIRTYIHFEDKLNEGEYTYIDPLASFVEALGNLSIGEQVWLQIVSRPAPGDEMRKQGLKLVDEMMKRKGKAYSDLVSKYLIGAMHISVDSVGAGFGVEPPGAGEDDEEERLPMLTPGERETLKALEENITKLAYYVKMRLVYIAKRQIYNKAKFAASLGGLLVFNTTNLNGFKVNKKTKTSRDYAKWQVPRLQRKLIANYKKRDMDAGANPFILSTQEMATIFHFPYMTTKSPTLERSATRMAQPPPDLPFA